MKNEPTKWVTSPIPADVYSCTTTGSMSNIIGGLTYILKDYLLKTLPKNLIKNVWTEGQMISTQMDTASTFKPEKPIMAIKPHISLDFNMYDSILPTWHRSDLFTFQSSYNYVPILGNRKKGIYVYSTPTRVKVNFEVVLLLSTRMQQIDLAYQINGLLPMNRPHKLTSFALETPIPRFYMETIRDALKLDNNSPDDLMQFNDFILKSTQNFFYKKRILSTGKDEYVYQFKPIINTAFSDLDLDEGEETGQIKKNYRVSFNVSFECWVPYYLILDIVDTTRTFTPPTDYNYEDLNTVSRTLHLNLGDPIPEEVNNRQLKLFEGFILDQKTVDSVNFAESLTYDMDVIIKYIQDHGMKIEDTITAVVYQNRIKEPDTNYSIDWDTKTLYQKRFIPNSVYHLALYFDMNKYTKIIYELSSNKKQFDKQEDNF